MVKITFMGAGSCVFSKRVIGDCMVYSEVLQNAEFALYDIDEKRLEESYQIICALNKNINENRATVTKFLGVENRKDALRNADFVINAIQVGFYDPCTIIDFEIPKKYGLRQTIGDTLGIGGIFRGLRTIRVMKEFAADMEEVCPNAWLLNYTNPMAMITGYMQRYTKVKTIGLCHSVQVCSKLLLKRLDMEDKLEGRSELIAGINHMGWLLDIRDKDGNDLYPEIKRRAKKMNAEEKHKDMVRFDYIDKFGYYCTESSEHNAEYNFLYIKENRPELIEKFNIPLDEYPRRCMEMDNTKAERRQAMEDGTLDHELTTEYACRIMTAILTNVPYKFGGNVMNNGLISNLPADACVEVPCYADNAGIHPTYIGALPLQCAAMNQTNINVQLLTIAAAREQSMEHVYHAALLDPHTGSQLSTDEIISLCDELRATHESAGYPIF